MIGIMSKKNDPALLAYALKHVGGIGKDTEVANNIQEQFGVCKKTAYKAIKDAYHAMVEEGKAMIPYRKVRQRMTLEMLAKESIEMSRKKGTSNGFGVAIKALQELAKIDGLYAPEQVEINDSRKRPEDMTTEERRKELKALLLQREEAGLPPIDGLGELDVN